MGRNDDALILQSRRLVRKIAMSLTVRFGGELDDFVQSGMVGLIDAVRRFDETKGRNFHAYASTRIHGQIVDDFRRFDTVPRWEREQRRKDPKRVETDKSRQLHSHRDYKKDLDRIVDHRLDVVPEQFDLASVVVELLNRLPLQQRDIMYRRYFMRMTDPQIAPFHGVSPSRICQIRREAERRMRVVAAELKISSIDDVI